MSNNCPRGLALVSDGTRGRPTVPGDSGPSPRDCGFDHLYWAARAGAQGPAVLTNSPGRFGPVPQGPWGRLAVPGDSHLGPSACGVDQLSRTTRARVRGTAVSTNSPRRLKFVSEGPRSTCSPGRLGNVPDDPRGQTAVPGTQAVVRGPAVLTSCPRGLSRCPKASNIHQLSRATRTRV